jgi:hypothetical protein
MIISIFDYNISGIPPVVGPIDYQPHMQGHIHFEERKFPISDITLEFIYVGF